MSQLSSYPSITSTHTSCRHAEGLASTPALPKARQTSRLKAYSPTARNSYTRKQDALSELCSLQAHLEHARRVDDDLVKLVAHAESAPAAPGVCVGRVSRDESAPGRPLQQSNRWRWLDALAVLLPLLCTGPKILGRKGAHVSGSGCKGKCSSLCKSRQQRVPGKTPSQAVGARKTLAQGGVHGQTLKLTNRKTR